MSCVCNAFFTEHGTYKKGEILRDATPSTRDSTIAGCTVVSYFIDTVVLLYSSGWGEAFDVSVTGWVPWCAAVGVYG